MTGDKALVKARLRNYPVGGVDVVIGGKPDIDVRDGKYWFALAVEVGEATGLDLRCCQGMPVFIYADNYESGFPFFDRVQDFDPALVALCAPETLLRFDGKRLEQWEI